MADKSADYLSEPQQVVLALIEALAASFPNARRVAELQGHTGYSRDQVYRGLKNLESAGWAECLDAGWMLSSHATHLSDRVRLTLARLHHTYLGDAA